MKSAIFFALRTNRVGIFSVIQLFLARLVFAEGISMKFQCNSYNTLNVCNIIDRARVENLSSK